MEAPKTLRRPANWQDFETLCKKLWGEIWECPEIQKNGRLGQDQSGVDIFGIPSSENDYYGIQCKGKSEYNDNHPQFTESEISLEIEKAKKFLPKLKKLYFATTALNDSKIQTFVRLKNIENKSLGLFEIHLFCWETIVELIEENKNTSNWYIKNQNYKSNKLAKITFQNNLDELDGKVTFQQLYTDFRQRIVPASLSHNSFTPAYLFEDFNFSKNSPFQSKTNNSYLKFFLRIHNIGNDPIENFKILLRFEGDFQDLDTVTKGGHFLMPTIKHTYDTFIDKENKTGKIFPLNKILVGEDTMGFDDIQIKPILEDSTVIIHWKIISKDYKNEGKLKLNLSSEILAVNKTVLVTDPFEVKLEIGEVEDHITANE